MLHGFPVVKVHRASAALGKHKEFD